MDAIVAIMAILNILLILIDRNCCNYGNSEKKETIWILLIAIAATKPLLKII